MTAQAFKLSREAQYDLEDIEDYMVRAWGRPQAERYLIGIFEAFEKLVLDPCLGHNRQDVPSPYLAYMTSSHLIIYRYNDGRQRAEILNILHPSMDIEKRLKDALVAMKKDPP